MVNLSFDVSLNDGVFVTNNPVNFVDPWGLFNPTKGIAAVGTALNSGRLAAAGTLKLLAAGGMAGTGVGAPAGVGTAIVGVWNLSSSEEAMANSAQLWSEAIGEDWDDASWRNLLGMLPFGTEYDDPCEPSIGEFWKDKAKDYKNKPGEAIRELGMMGF